MGEGAVTEVLGEVVDPDEGLDADPVDALAAHLGVPHDLADPIGVHQPDQAVAADAATDEGALGHLGSGGVGATRAEVRRPGRDQPDELLAPDLDRWLLGRRRWGQSSRVELGQQPGPERLDQSIGVDGAMDRDQDAILGIPLADDARRCGHAVERFAELALDEGSFLLDDEDLLQAPGEGPGDLPVERVRHRQLEDPDAVGGQVLLGQAEGVGRGQDLVIGPAGGHDAEPGIARVVGDPVQLVLDPVASSQLHAGLVDLPLDRVGHRATEAAGDPGPVGLAVPLQCRDDRGDSLGADLGRARAVGHRGHDLDPGPEPGRTGQVDAVAAKVQDLLDVAGVQDREVEIGQGELGTRRQGRGLVGGVVAGQGQDAAVLVGAGVLGVADGVSGPVQARCLPVPDPQHPVVALFGEGGGHLTAHDRGGAQLLVEARLVDHVVGVHQGLVGDDLPIEPAKR